MYFSNIAAPPVPVNTPTASYVCVYVSTRLRGTSVSTSLRLKKFSKETEFPNNIQLKVFEKIENLLMYFSSIADIPPDTP